MVTANQKYRESGTTLTFKDWMEREKAKETFIPFKDAQEEFFNADGSPETPSVDVGRIDANKKLMMDLAMIALLALISYGAFKLYKSMQK